MYARQTLGQISILWGYVRDLSQIRYLAFIIFPTKRNRCDWPFIAAAPTKSDWFDRRIQEIPGRI